MAICCLHIFKRENKLTSRELLSIHARLHWEDNVFTGVERNENWRSRRRKWPLKAVNKENVGGFRCCRERDGRARQTDRVRAETQRGGRAKDASRVAALSREGHTHNTAVPRGAFGQWFFRVLYSTEPAESLPKLVPMEHYIKRTIIFNHNINLWLNIILRIWRLENISFIRITQIKIKSVLFRIFLPRTRLNFSGN